MTARLSASHAGTDGGTGQRRAISSGALLGELFDPRVDLHRLGGAPVAIIAAGGSLR